MPKTSSMVWELAKALPDSKNFKLAFDNWFCSPILIHRVFCRGIQFTATFQTNRFRGLTFNDDKEKSSGGGTFTRLLGHNQDQYGQVV